MAIHAFLCFPETAGKPLEEIEEIFALGTPAWKTKAQFAVGRQMERGERDEKTIQTVLEERNEQV